MDYDYLFKILVLGDHSVGKTTLTLKYLTGSYEEDIKLTIGVDFHTKKITFQNKKINLQIWDFGGEERFRFFLPKYCEGASAAFFLYDITNPVSLDHLPDWIRIVREKTENIPIILVGSKLDLKKWRAVSKNKGRQATEKYNCSAFIELSSKTGEYVDEAFQLMGDILLKNVKR